MPQRWSNPGGAGDRSALVTVSKTATGGSGPIDNAVDGLFAENNTDSWDWSGGQSSKEIKFDFGSYPKKITKAVWYRSGVLDSDGFWKLTASDDDISYSDISGSVEVVGTVGFFVFDSTGINDDFYRYYKFVQTSGTTSSAAWHLEIEFLISGENGEDDTAEVAPDYANVQGTGNRKGKIAISGTITVASGNFRDIIDGTANNTMWLDGGQTDRYIEFDFFNPVLITELKWYQDGANSQGTWKWQGYDETALAWEDLGSTFILGSSATTTVAAMSAVTEYYSKYRLQQVSGSTTSSPYVTQIEFKVGLPEQTNADLISGVDPDTGPTAGGTPVTISGVGFTAATGVLFDTDPATSFLVVDDTEITCETPAHSAATVDVTVQRPTTDLVAPDSFIFSDVEESNPVRATQVPLLVIDQTSQNIRLTQAVLLVLVLQEQPIRVTQVPVLVLDKPKPIPLPAVIVPEVPVTEIWQWKTVVNVAEGSKEQRTAVRKDPKIISKFSAELLDDTDRRVAYQLLYKFMKDPFFYPMYVHSTRLLQTSVSGTSKLYFEPANTDIRPGEQLAVFDPQLSETRFVTVDTVDVDGATLDEPVNFDALKNWLVCPSPEFRTRSSIALQMESVSGDFSLDMITLEGREILRPGQVSELLIYDGLPVLNKRPLANSSVEEQFIRDVTWVDNEINRPQSNSGWANAFISGEREYLAHRPQGLDYWRELGDNLRGMQGIFILPTFRQDLPLSQVPVLSATSIVTSNVQFFDYWRAGTYRYLRIQSKTGEIYRRINDVTPNYDSGGNPVSLTVVLSEAISASVGSNQDMVVSFANLCRLDSDEIVFVHDYVDTVVQIKVRGINE